MGKKNITEEQKQLNRERVKKWYQQNKERALARIKKWNEDNSEHRKDYMTAYRKEHISKRKEWCKTVFGRASYLVSDYKQFDKICGRPKGDLTAKWVAENILTKPCAHCGETDWRKIGCNRIDNTKPHTKDNVEPCCWKCNTELAIKTQGKKVYQYTLDGVLVKIWNTASECARNGFTSVSSVCRKDMKPYKGYLWSYNLKT